MFLLFRLEIFKDYLYVMTWYVFNKNYVQILTKLCNLILTQPLMDIMWVRLCPRFRLTFNISSSVAVKQLPHSACTTFKFSLLDIHKTNTEFYVHATKFLVAYMTEKGISLVYKLNYLFL